MNWISVKDSLPDATKRPPVYLCWCPERDNIYGGTKQVLFFGRFSWLDYDEVCPDADEDGEVLRFGWYYERESEGEYDSLVFDMNDKVTHWMPLPNAPVEE